jgi:hypothetical protein
MKKEVNISETDKIWLVKSNERIIGPFSQVDILKQIRERRLHPLDEVRGSLSRWLPLRQSPQFASAILQIMTDRSLMFETKSSDFTETEDLTPTPKREVVEPVLVPEAVVKASPESIKSYAYEKDPVKISEVREGLEDDGQRRRTIVTYLAVVVVLVAGYFFFSRQSPSPVNKDQSQIFALIKSYQDAGRYKESAQVISQNFKIADLNMSDLRQLMPTLIQSPEFLHDTLRSVSGLLNQTEEKNPDRKDLFVWQGVLAHRLGQFEDAESSFSQIPRAEGNTWRKVYNRSWNLVKMGQLVRAVKILNELEKSSATEHLSIYKAFLAIEQKIAEQQRERLRELKSWRQPSSSMYWANLVMSLRLAKELNDLEQFENLLSEMLQGLPTEVDAFLLDWELLSDLIEPKFLAFILEQTIEGVDNPKGLAMRSLSAFWSGDMARALSVIDQARKRYSEDPDLLAWQIFYLWKAQRTQEAKALTKYATNANTSLRLIVEAEMSLAENDFAVFDSKLDFLGTTESGHSFYFDLKGRGAWKKKNKIQALSAIREGLSRAPNYKPLLQLKGEIGE